MIAEPGGICGSTSRANRNGARSMTPRKWSSISSSVSWSGLGLPTPALLTRKSIRPHRSRVASTIRLGASSSVRLTASVATRSGSSIAFFNSESLPSSRPVPNTAMPRSASLLAQPKPMPPLAPVTIATCISPVCLRKRCSYLMLEYLPRVVSGQLLPDHNLFRHFERGNTAVLQKAAQVRDVRTGQGGGNDGGARPFPGAGIGHTDDGHFGDAGMADEDVLDFLW